MVFLKGVSRSVPFPIVNFTGYKTIIITIKFSFAKMLPVPSFRQRENKFFGFRLGGGVNKLKRYDDVTYIKVHNIFAYC